MKLIIGLGNPDKEYAKTRHNFGWLVINALAEKKDLVWKKHKASNSLITYFKIDQEKIDKLEDALDENEDISDYYSNISN